MSILYTDRGMRMSQDIQDLRKEIEKIDDQILSLAAKRMQLAENVGKIKKANQKPIKNYAVEKRIIERMRKKSEELGTDKDLGEGLVKTLIEYSCKRQNEIYHSNHTPSEASQNWTIVGGCGNMGNWIAEFAHTLGNRVTIQDIIKSKNMNPDWFFETDLKKSIENADVVILATPMQVTNEILLTLADWKTKAIIVELCSLKSPIKEGINKALKNGLSVISTHPMFGPSTEVLFEKNLILCPMKDQSESYNLVKDFIKKTPINLIEIPFSEHDDYMRYILGSSHLINLIYARLIDNSSIPLHTLNQVSGTTFQNQIEVTRTVVEENVDLYFEIQILNESTNVLFGELNKIIGEFEVALAKQDKDDFRKMMRKSKDFFSGKY